MTDELKSMINIKIIIIMSIIGVLNSFFYNDFLIMASVVGVEIIWLIWCIIRNDDMEYILWYMVFLAFSLENASYVGDDAFFGFKNFRILGLNIAVWMLLPIFFKQIWNGIFDMRYMSNPLRRFDKEVVFITFSGIFIGLVTYLVNDNELRYAEGSLQQFINSVYMFVFVCLEVLTISSVLSKNKEQIIRCKMFCVGMIIAYSLVCICCILLGNYGNRGGLPSLQISNLYFLIIPSILLIIYDNFIKLDKIIIFISSIITLVSALIYNSNGKMIILTATAPFIAIMILLKKSKSPKNVLTGIVIAIVGVMAFMLYIPDFLDQSVLFSAKYQQFLSMISFWEPGWLSNMESSPKMRITEFLNIGYELLTKPWYLIEGKGFMGSIQDKLNLFGTVDQFSFSEWELFNGAYFQMHESVNQLFLTNGLIGLWFLFNHLFYMIKNIDKSPWLIFGFLWLLLFYTYSLTISIFGVMTLVVGYLEVDKKSPYITGKGFYKNDYKGIEK